MNEDKFKTVGDENGNGKILGDLRKKLLSQNDVAKDSAEIQKGIKAVAATVLERNRIDSEKARKEVAEMFVSQKEKHTQKEFTFPEEVVDKYTNGGKDKEALDRLKSYEKRIKEEVLEINEMKNRNGKKLDLNQYALEWLLTKSDSPKKLVGIFKEKLEKEKSEEKAKTDMEKEEKRRQAEEDRKNREAKKTVAARSNPKGKNEQKRQNKFEFGSPETVWKNEQGEEIVIKKSFINSTDNKPRKFIKAQKIKTVDGKNGVGIFRPFELQKILEQGGFKKMEKIEKAASQSESKPVEIPVEIADEEAIHFDNENEANELGEEELRFVSIYVEYAKDYNQDVGEYYSKDNGFREEDTSFMINGQMNKFWDQDFAARIVEDGDIEKEKVKAFVELIKQKIEE